MMHLCRELFPTLLETPGLLSSILLEHFQPSKFLYHDIINNNKEDEFKNYIYNFVDVEKTNGIEVKKTPKELLSEAGYELFECKTEEEIQYFKKYYAPREELCTFNGGRLNSCYVFFAIKKNVDEIKRENFDNPKREDEYGTSVISIQFRKTPPNTLSIKNRYNHRVNNPDNTFNNNLDNIIPGLNQSFEDNYNLSFETNNNKFELPNYVNVNGKFYKYNYEINNIYYCPNNIIIDNFKVIDKYIKEPERYIVMNYYIIDLKEKSIKLYSNSMISMIRDGFVNEFKNIENITISKEKETGNKTIEIIYDKGKQAHIIIDKTNQIIGYHNDFQTKMDDYCLNYANNLLTFETSNLTEMGKNCLFKVNNLRTFKASKLQKMDEYCLYAANNLLTFEAPNLTKMGYGCLAYVKKLLTFEVPNLVQMLGCSLKETDSLKNFEAPNLIKMGACCLREANGLRTFTAPKLQKMDDYCLYDANKLLTFEAFNLTEMGFDCLFYVHNLRIFKAPNLTKMGMGCLKYSNISLAERGPRR